MCSTCACFASTHGSVFERTHGDVFNLHTGRRDGGRGWEKGGSLLSLSLVPSLSLSLFLRSLSLLSFSSLFPLLSSLSSLSATMTMITRPVGSLCVHPALPYSAGRSACTLAYSLSSEHVRIMQETNCPGITVQDSCPLGISGPVSVLEMGDVYVFVCVWLCLVLLVCVSMCCPSLCCWLRQC